MTQICAKSANQKGENKMLKFQFDFEGCLIILAETEAEAWQKFFAEYAKRAPEVTVTVEKYEG